MSLGDKAEFSERTIMNERLLDSGMWAGRIVICTYNSHDTSTAGIWRNNIYWGATNRDLGVQNKSSMIAACASVSTLEPGGPAACSTVAATGTGPVGAGEAGAGLGAPDL